MNEELEKKIKKEEYKFRIHTIFRHIEVLAKMDDTNNKTIEQILDAIAIYDNVRDEERKKDAPTVESKASTAQDSACVL